MAGLPTGAGQGLFEAPTLGCAHCGTIVILNPARQRERAYCPKCDRYMCDNCGAAYGVSRECKPFAKLLDRVQEVAVNRPIILLGT